MAKIELKDCIKSANEIAEDAAYKVKAARSPKNKRSAKYASDFWSSIAEHLENYQKTLS